MWKLRIQLSAAVIVQWIWQDAALTAVVHTVDVCVCVCAVTWGFVPLEELQKQQVNQTLVSTVS